MGRSLNVDELLDGFLAATGAYGVRFGLVAADSVPIWGARGLDGRMPESPMCPSGRLRIGSITKTFTSAMTLRLIGAGRMTLDDPLARWMERYPNAGGITVGHLLSHTSGTADPIFDDFAGYLGTLLADVGRHFSTREVVEYASLLAPAAAPGEAYRYSNTNFHLLGAIVEREMSASYAECLAELATSIDIAHTSFDLDRPADLAHGWFDLDAYVDGSLGDRGAARARDLDVLDLDNTALISLAYAAGGITSSLDDLLRWGRALYCGDVLAPPERGALLASPASDDADIGGWAGYGVFGIGAPAVSGSWEMYGHVGNIVGSTAALFAWPTREIVVAIHANIQEVGAPALVDLARQLRAAVLDES